VQNVTVLVADDHAIVLEGLVSLLREHDVNVVGAVRDGHALLDAARRLRPDVIVTDVSMPGISGLDVLPRLRAHGVRSRVIVLTMHHDQDLAARALRAGASAFVLKLSAGRELLTAMREALAGRTYVTPTIAGDAPGRD
jgi:DNA-binding NarL/FixJ family response regulator